MRRTPRIASVLDQFVREVDFDEGIHSWHPKAALVRMRRTDGTMAWRLWIGSRNLTECVNREIGILLLSGGKGCAPIKGAEELARALADTARLIAAPTVEHVPDAAALEDEKLEQARAQVAARWAGELTHDEHGFELRHSSTRYPNGPHPDEPDITLQVGPLHGKLIPWPSSQTVIRLGQIAPAERSEFVRLRLSRGDVAVSWLQRAPAEPPFGEERDRAAFVRFLGARGFLLWLAGLLAEDDRQGEGDWTKDAVESRPTFVADLALDSSLPTLEEMLAAWARNEAKFREIDRRISQYLPCVLPQS